MSKKNYEKPQKGNPHGLTIDQHVFPKRSIERFAGQDGRVYVYLKSKQVYFQAAPGDVIFCAKRIWDQRAEYGYMREIEDKFQALAESIICGDLKEIDQQNTEILNDFLVGILQECKYSCD